MKQMEVKQLLKLAKYYGCVRLVKASVKSGNLAEAQEILIENRQRVIAKGNARVKKRRAIDPEFRAKVRGYESRSRKKRKADPVRHEKSKVYQANWQRERRLSDYDFRYKNRELIDVRQNIWKEQMLDWCDGQSVVSGYSLETLDFHHVNPNSKKRSPARAIDDWFELEKCVPLTHGEHISYHWELARIHGGGNYPPDFDYKSHFKNWCAQYREEKCVDNNSQYGQFNFWECLK